VRHGSHQAVHSSALPDQSTSRSTGGASGPHSAALTEGTLHPTSSCSGSQWARAPALAHLRPRRHAGGRAFRTGRSAVGDEMKSSRTAQAVRRTTHRSGRGSAAERWIMNVAEAKRLALDRILRDLPPLCQGGKPRRGVRGAVRTRDCGLWTNRGACGTACHRPRDRHRQGSRS